MLLYVAHESLSGGLPFGISGFRFRLTFRADGVLDFFFQLVKKALALCAVWASGLIHFVCLAVGLLRYDRLKVYAI